MINKLSKNRKLAIGLGNLAMLPFYIYCIYIGIKYDCDVVTVFWSVWLGMVLTLSLGLIARATKQE
jgi:hypothetical protein